MLIEMFNKRFEPGLYTLRYYLLGYMVEYIRKFDMVPILDSSLYEHYIVHSKAAHKSLLLRGRPEILNNINVIEKR